MDVSMSSTLHNHLQFTHLPHKSSLKRQNNSKIVSCRAHTSSERNTLNFQKMLPRDCNNGSVYEIKKAYRKLALQYHPDVCEPSRKDECTKIFIEIQDIYRSLLDTPGEAGRGVGLKGKQCRGWESQIAELNRKSQSRKAQTDGSWGCRLRAQFRYV